MNQVIVLYYMPPQTDGQTEVIKRTLSLILRAILKKNLRERLLMLNSHITAVHSTTKFCPFEIVYGFKPTAPTDLLPLPLQERANMDAGKQADFVKKLHEKAKENIEKDDSPI